MTLFVGVAFEAFRYLMSRVVKMKLLSFVVPITWYRLQGSELDAGFHF